MEKYYAISSQIMLTYIAIGKYERTLFPEGKLCPHNKKMQLQIWVGWGKEKESKEALQFGTTLRAVESPYLFLKGMLTDGIVLTEVLWK